MRTLTSTCAVAVTALALWAPPANADWCSRVLVAGTGVRSCHPDYGLPSACVGSDELEPVDVRVCGPQP